MARGRHLSQRTAPATAAAPKRTDDIVSGLQRSGSERPRLMSVSEVADLFGRTDRTIRNWVRTGILHPRRVGRSVFFLESDVMKLLDGDTPHASDKS